MKPNIPPDPHADCQRDLDEARAIARRLAAAYRTILPVNSKSLALVAFDALPWAKAL